jgi:hypothetical protein
MRCARGQRHHNRGLARTLRRRRGCYPRACPSAVRGIDCQRDGFGRGADTNAVLLPPLRQRLRLCREEGGGRCVRGLDRSSPTSPRTQRPIQVGRAGSTPLEQRIGWGWRAAQKINLIERTNPNWIDLYPTLPGVGPLPALAPAESWNLGTLGLRRGQASPSMTVERVAVRATSCHR